MEHYHYIICKWNEMLLELEHILWRVIKYHLKWLIFYCLQLRGMRKTWTMKTSPIDSYFLGGGRALSTEKPADFINEPKAHISIRRLPERSSPWTPHVTEKKPDKLLFSSTATLLSAQLEILKDNSWKRSMCLVEYTYRFIN